MNRELLHVQAEFRKGRGTRDQIANIHWIIKKSRELQKIYQDGEHMYTCGGFILIFGKTNTIM